MVCYAIPTTAAVIHYFMRKNNPKIGKSIQHRWLNLLLVGGAIFGIVDHAWNGELLLFGPNLFMDLALGAVITLAIVIAWQVMVLYDKVSSKSENKVSQD